jgi:hypothetical protein
VHAPLWRRHAVVAFDRLDRQIQLRQRDPPQALACALVAEQCEVATSRGRMARRATSALGARQRDAYAQRDRRCERCRKRRDNGAMSSLPPAEWWTIRRAANRKPSTYRCPFCSHHLPALSEHMLIAPEGDSRRRRHAHTACVLAARRDGRLVLRDEWLRSQPRPPSLWRRLLRRA